MQHLATTCPALDALLDGGLEADAITLVFGEGGSGKTNLALQCAREAAKAGKRTAYVDTEGVSGIRLRQVFLGALRGAPSAPGLDAAVDILPGAAADGPARDGPGAPAMTAARSIGRRAHEARDDEDDAAQDDAGAGPAAGGRVAPERTGGSVMASPTAMAGTLTPEQEEELRELESRVLFITPYTIEEQERMVLKATKLPDLGLVVVDSINMHYRLHIDGGADSESDAARSLYKQLHHLTAFARQHQVPVLVTGQVYGGEDTTQPFARRVMEHLVKALLRFEKRPDGSRRATVIKHRSIEEGRGARFRIGPSGLEAAERP